jgi:hypothetical protein
MRSRSLVAAGLSLVVVGVQSFGRPVTLVLTTNHYQPNAASPLTSSTQLRMTPPPDAPAGSFFNRVPSNDDDAEKKKKQHVPPTPLPSPIVPEATTTENSSSSSSDDNKDDLDEKLTQLLRQRQKPPRASRPSTINGVPTEKASGRLWTLCVVQFTIFF